MKPVVSDKYSIAWFKIAECVAKGERERALGMYRLLSHSIDNQALAKQLEADILLFFADERAPEKYKEAALLYAQQNKYLEAIALYEQLLTLQAGSAELLPVMVEWSFELLNKDKIRMHGLALASLLLEQNNFEEFHVLFDRVVLAAGHSEKSVALLMRLIESAIGNKFNESQIISLIHHGLDSLMLDADQQLLQSFVSQLQQRYPVYYQQSCSEVQG